jgi:4'-phosphopantetheinyl transferase EntD
MIDRLLITLRALAASPDEQIERFPNVVATPDELALDFDDAYLLLQQCQQLELSAAQREAVGDVDHLLAQMTEPERRALWTEAAFRRAPEWERVRSAARTALRLLGYAAGPLSRSAYPES